MAKHFHCPVNDWECPYYKNEADHPCLCTIGNPIDECDAFYYAWGGYKPDEYTDDHD